MLKKANICVRTNVDLSTVPAEYAGKRVLLRGQTDPQQNGLYDVGTAWERIDAPIIYVLVGAEAGDPEAGSGPYIVRAGDPPTVIVGW